MIYVLLVSLNTCHRNCGRRGIGCINYATWNRKWDHYNTPWKLKGWMILMVKDEDLLDRQKKQNLGEEEKVVCFIFPLEMSINGKTVSQNTNQLNQDSK